MVRRPTLKDVADQAGVSTATVARVLHEKGYVSEQAREQVNRALAETGYQINAVAQGLRRQRTYTVGHILNSIIPNQFFAAVAEGVEEIASHHGCSVLMVTTHGDADQERDAVQTLIQRRVDAIIFTTATYVDNVRQAVRAGMPVVQVERMTSVDTPVVTADNFGGAYAATEHLIQLGHRRVAFIGVDPSAVQSRPGAAAHPDVEQERLSGFLTAMGDHHIPVDDGLVTLESGYLNEPGVEGSRGYQPMDQFLKRPDRPTAVFAISDLLAAGALQAIYAHGLRVPEDISVVGFDDTFAPYLAPPMTAVENPMLDMGRVAARTVFHQLADAPPPEARLGSRLPMRLIVRASSTSPVQNTALSTAMHTNAIDDT